MVKILVADDDAQVHDLLSVSLPLLWEGVAILTARTGDDALRRFMDEDPDVVLIDMSLRGVSGFEVLRQIRLVSDAPVLILAARGDEIDEVRGLELGADDYIVKPFGVLALKARIRAVLRRTELSPLARGVPDFTAGPLTLCFDRRQVAVNGQALHLTPVEFKLLYHLARNAGHLLTHDALLDRIWGPDSYRTADHLKMYVSRLRGKIERAGGPRCIENERGLGYRFVKPPPPPAAGRPPCAVDRAVPVLAPQRHAAPDPSPETSPETSADGHVHGRGSAVDALLTPT